MIRGREETLAGVTRLTAADAPGVIFIGTEDVFDIDRAGDVNADGFADLALTRTVLPEAREAQVVFGDPALRPTIGAPATVSVTASAAAPPPPEGAIELFLVDPVTDQVVAEIGADGRVDPRLLTAGRYAIEARADGAASVTFQIDDGPIKREGFEPYALFGDGPPGDFAGRAVPNAPFALTVRAFADVKARGPTIAERTAEIDFVAPDADPLRLFLIAADSDRVVDEIGPDGVIDASLLDGEAFAIEARFDGPAESILFKIDDRPGKTESLKPFALFGDGAGGTDFFGEALPGDAFQLRVRVFSEDRARGDLLADETLQLTVDDPSDALFG